MPSHRIRARAAQGRVGAGIFVLDTSPELIARYLDDAAHFPGGRADAVARPVAEAEVAAVLSLSTSLAKRVLTVGAQSSVTGGATPDGGIVMSTERLVSIQPAGATHVRVGAGVPLQVLQQTLAERGASYPPVPTFTGACAGGVVATNAAGAATFKYGTTRAWVDGLTVMLACACVLDLERGEVMADGHRGFEIVCAHGTRPVQPGRYTMPSVAKCSAGYFAAANMDLIDLFIGSEGTLGIVLDVTLRVLPASPAIAMFLVSAADGAGALGLVDELRRASHETWRTRDPDGIDVAAIESLDRRCLEFLHEDSADRTNDVTMHADTAMMLVVQLELPPGTTSTAAFDEIGGWSQPNARDSALTRVCRLLDRHGVLDRTEMAMPDDTRRKAQFLAFREAAPMGVNRRIVEAKRTIDARMEKTAADMIVPFERLSEMLQVYEDGYRRRGLDFAIWGHVSDGNLHPNVLPRSYDDIIAGKDAILEFGREAVRLGGCPLAEHGVGRSAMKQTLLRQLYGDAGIADMRAIKRALDPEWKLAPGVLFSET